MSLNHREAFRLTFSPKVICFLHDGQVFIGKLHNISRTGCYMEYENVPSISGKCKVDIALDGHHSRLKIEQVCGNIARCDENGIAINFDESFEWIPVVPIFEPKVQDWNK